MDWFLYDIGLRRERVKRTNGSLKVCNVSSHFPPSVFFSAECRLKWKPRVTEIILSFNLINAWYPKEFFYFYREKKFPIKTNTNYKE